MRPTIKGIPTINRVVAIEFPKLQKKFGDAVTYAQDHKAHIQTEFGFDMAQVAKNRYTSDRYHDFIGFEVSKPLLERAFYRNLQFKIGRYFWRPRFGHWHLSPQCPKIIPQMTRVALLSRHDEIINESPTFKRKQFLYYLSRTQYEHEWGRATENLA